MAKQEYIKYLYEVEEKGLNEISRICGVNFRTAEKYAKKSDWNADEKEERENKYPVLGEYLETIDKWLEEDGKMPRKQRHTIKRVYERLKKEEGYSGSYGSVKKYINKRKQRQQKAGYLPIKHECGNAEIDFGEIVYEDGAGDIKKGWHFTMTFPYSNAGYVQVFRGQNQECLLEGMKRIFERIGGVPKQIKMDNMKTVVIKILEEGKRETTENFTRFRLHYGFEAEFCNPASGNEKGNVENKVGYWRRNFFVPMPKIEDFEEYNKQLFEMCEEDFRREHYAKGAEIRELFEEEKEALKILPENEYKIFKIESIKADNYGFVKIDGNRYGITPELSGKTGYAKIYCEEIEIYFEHSLIKTYKRSYGSNEEITDWKQYAGTLAKKPGGLEYAKFYEQIPEIWREHLKSQNKKGRKSSLELLREIVREDKIDIGVEAAEIARLYGRNDTESIRQCYYGLTHGEFNPKPVELSVETPKIDYNPDLKNYDMLIAGGGDNAV